ncbi:MAG TPA: hypothetical protein PLU49_11640 [Saprospiraceae bacterium]|nr:hypothetical protein [Saprospiraceae bacterium]
MKTIHFANLFILLLLACQPNKPKDDLVNGKGSFIYPRPYKNGSDSHLPAEHNKIDTFQYLKSKFSINLNRQHYTFISDTLVELNYTFIAYGKFDKIDFFSHYLSYVLDSINVLTPMKSSLKFDDCISGFFYFEENKFNSGTIAIADIDNDGDNDFGIYNDCASGNGQNSTYSYWMNNGYGLMFNPEFSLPNFGYNNNSKEYYSRSSAGVGDIIETYYLLKDGKLIPLRSVETEYLDNDLIKYTKIDLIKRDTSTKINKWRY